MIILMDAKRATELGHETCERMLRAIAGDARIATGTPIMFLPDLPVYDDEGKPIFAFKVSGGEIHYWRGEPIILPSGLKINGRS